MPICVLCFVCNAYIRHSISHRFFGAYKIFEHMYDEVGDDFYICLCVCVCDGVCKRTHTCLYSTEETKVIFILAVPFGWKACVKNMKGKRLSIFIKHFYEFGNKSGAVRRVFPLFLYGFFFCYVV